MTPTQTMKQSHSTSPLTAGSEDLLAQSYRRFAHAIEHLADFSQFVAVLREMVQADPVFRASLMLQQEVDSAQGDIDQVFEFGKVVVPLAGRRRSAFLQFAGRHDQRFRARGFAPDGCHWGFSGGSVCPVEALSAAAGARSDYAIIDRSGASGDRCALPGPARWSSVMRGLAAGVASHESECPEAREVLTLLRDGLERAVEAHLEVDGRLLYAVRRCFDLQELKLVACLLYDHGGARRAFADDP